MIKEEDGVRITSMKMGSQIALHNTSGQLIHAEVTVSDEVKLPLPTAGVYVIKVSIDNHIETQKVVF